MATRADPLSRPDSEMGDRPARSDSARAAAPRDPIPSLSSLKSQLAQAEGSLATKEASLALARDLLRSRETQLTQLQAKLAMLESKFAEANANLEAARTENAQLKFEVDQLKAAVGSWRGLWRLLGHRLLHAIRYGL